MTKRKTVTSVNALALLIGKSAMTVARWMARDDWPAGRSAPYDVDKAIAYAKRQPPDNRSAPRDPRIRDQIERADLALKEERRRKLEAERAKLAGEYVLRADVEAEVIAMIHAARAALERIPRELSSRLVGLSEREIETRLRDAIDAALMRLSGESEE